MAGGLEALDPKEIVLLAVVLLGILPVALQYRARSKWFAAGYAMLVANAVSTNLEALFLNALFNGVEHVAGVLGVAALFLYAAYERRQTVLTAPEETDG